MIFGFLDKIRIDIKQIHNQKKVYDNKMSTNPGKRRDQQIFDEKSLEKSMQNNKKIIKTPREKNGISTKKSLTFPKSLYRFSKNISLFFRYFFDNEKVYCLLIFFISES